MFIANKNSVTKEHTLYKKNKCIKDWTLNGKELITCVNP